MVSLLVSKVDRLECAYTVYPILPAIRISPESSGRVPVLFKYRVICAVTGQFLHQVEFFEGWKPLSPIQLAVEEVMSE
ncbi:hypothetical protein Tco_1301743 [Tanacetum coccineum]